MTISIGLGMFVLAILFAFFLGCALVAIVWWKAAALISTDAGFDAFMRGFTSSRNLAREQGVEPPPLRCPCHGRGWI